MLLRFRADRRALFWSLILFPALPIAVFLKPALGPWLLPVALYLAYCSGVLIHNHNHTPTFRNKRLNSAYSAWLSFFYGAPAFAWIPTHNQNHHRHLNGPGDATRTSELAPRDTLLAALAYPTRSAIAQWPAIVSYVKRARASNAARFRQIVLETVAVVGGHALLAALAIARFGWVSGAWVYAWALGIPALSAAWSMMFTNYVQHVGCDDRSADDHSRNFVSRWLNWLVFDAGYHTVHHEHAGTHWSEYRALHAARAHRISPHLNQGSIFGYCIETYLLRAPTRDARTPTETDCDMPPVSQIAR